MTAAAAAAQKEEESKDDDEEEEEEEITGENETDEIAESEAFVFDSRVDRDDDEVEPDSESFQFPPVERNAETGTVLSGWLVVGGHHGGS